MTQADERREDWDAYRRLVIDKLESLDEGMRRLTVDIAGEIKNLRSDELGRLRSQVIELQIELATLKTKTAMIGAVAGFVCAGLVSYTFKAIGGP